MLLCIAERNDNRLPHLPPDLQMQLQSSRRTKINWIYEMKIMTYFNAKEKAEQRIEVLESNLGNLGNERIWKRLMHVLRQKQKFTERLVLLIQRADKLVTKK